MRLRISIGMPNFEMPNLDSVLLVQWLTESRLGISLLVQWLTESRFRNSAFEIRSLMYAVIGCNIYILKTQDKYFPWWIGDWKQVTARCWWIDDQIDDRQPLNLGPCEEHGYVCNHDHCVLQFIFLVPHILQSQKNQPARTHRFPPYWCSAGQLHYNLWCPSSRPSMHRKKAAEKNWVSACPCVCK